MSHPHQRGPVPQRPTSETTNEQRKPRPQSSQHAPKSGSEVKEAANLATGEQRKPTMQKPAGVSPDANPIDMVGQQKISTFDFSFTPFGHQSAAPQQKFDFKTLFSKPVQMASAPQTAPQHLSYAEERTKYASFFEASGAQGDGSRNEEVRNSPLFSLAVKHRVDFGIRKFEDGKIDGLCAVKWELTLSQKAIRRQMLPNISKSWTSTTKTQIAASHRLRMISMPMQTLVRARHLNLLAERPAQTTTKTTRITKANPTVLAATTAIRRHLARSSRFSRSTVYSDAALKPRLASLLANRSCSTQVLRALPLSVALKEVARATL